jgi:hypothetical protein
MNIRRGLFRIWLVASLAWIVSSFWMFDYSCFFGHYPWCDWWVVSPLLSSTYVEVLVKTFGPPLVALVGGMAAFWSVAGFKSN